MMRLSLYRNFLLSDRRRLGRWGENYCLRQLRNKGFKLLARNYSCSRGEIDLIFIEPAASANALVFVEVKTRISEKFYTAQSAVNYKKRQKIAATARYFINNYNVKDKPVRFDIAAVILPRKGPVSIRHYTNAFVP